MLVELWEKENTPTATLIWCFSVLQSMSIVSSNLHNNEGRAQGIDLPSPQMQDVSEQVRDPCVGV